MTARKRLLKPRIQLRPSWGGCTDGTDHRTVCLAAARPPRVCCPRSQSSLDRPAAFPLVVGPVAPLDQHSWGQRGATGKGTTSAYREANAALQIPVSLLPFWGMAKVWLFFGFLLLWRALNSFCGPIFSAGGCQTPACQCFLSAGYAFSCQNSRSPQFKIILVTLFFFVRKSPGSHVIPKKIVYASTIETQGRPFFSCLWLIFPWFPERPTPRRGVVTDWDSKKKNYWRFFGRMEVTLLPHIMYIILHNIWCYT